MKVICNKRFSCLVSQTCQHSKIHDSIFCLPCSVNDKSVCKKVTFKSGVLLRIDECKDTKLANLGIVQFNEYNGLLYEDENGNQIVIFMVSVFSIFRCGYIHREVCLEKDFKVVCLTNLKEVVS